MTSFLVKPSPKEPKKDFSTIAPNSYAANGYRTHGRVAPPRGTFRRTLCRLSYTAATEIKERWEMLFFTLRHHWRIILTDLENQKKRNSKISDQFRNLVLGFGSFRPRWKNFGQPKTGWCPASADSAPRLRPEPGQPAGGVAPGLAERTPDEF